MKTIVVGGNRRAAGKTAVIEGILRAFPMRSWTAAKVTAHAHKESGSGCCDIFEEQDRSGGTDTARYLAAGAARALLVQLRPDCLEQGIVEMRTTLQDAPLVIIESNTIVPFLRPDVFVFVIRRDVSDWKPSACATVEKADALIVLSSGAEPNSVERVPAALRQGSSVFETSPPDFAPKPFLEWIARRIGG
jgi:hypothetical protein